MFKSFKTGLKYALMFMVVAASMGFVYGAFGGVVLAPMLFAITVVGIFSCMNFVIALLVAGIPLLFISILKKRAPKLVRYFAISLSFFVVYLPFFALLKVLPTKVF